MQPDLLLLVERLVVAIERMSQDLKNISTYVCDKSHGASHFQNERRRNEGENIVSEVMQDDSAEGEQGDQNSVVHSLQHGDISVDVASLTEIIKIENQSESEQNDESCDNENTGDDGRNNASDIPQDLGTNEGWLPLQEEREVCAPIVALEREVYLKEINQQPYLNSNEVHSSSQPLSVAVVGMSTQGYFSRSSGFSGQETILLQDHQTSEPFTTAFSSIADDTLGLEGATCRYVSEEPGEEQVARVRKRPHTDQNESERDAISEESHPERQIQVPASLNGSSEESERSSRMVGYECFECKRTFPRKSNLLRHEQVHSNERPFKCAQCGKAFKGNWNLRMHMLTHTNEELYKCGQCGLTFKRTNDLTVHLRSHTAEKPFKSS